MRLQTRGMENKGRAVSYGAALFVLLVVAIATGAWLGAQPVSFFDADSASAAILYEIRLPRVFLGACVGASLAVAGAGLQSLLRNPLAEPYLLGVSNGAALGTMVAILAFGSYEFARPLIAFVGAALATFAVYRMARSRAGMNAERLILSGVIVTTLLSSVIILLTSLLDATRLRSFTFWLLGDLSQATKWGFLVCLVSAIAGTLLLSTQARALNLMMVGERDALDFGVEVERTRLIVFSAAAGLVGVAVSASGSVGFVGLIVPHLIRLAVGSDNRLVVPFSALFGASFVVLADTAARTLIAPRELPVGAITALIGCPMFIWLLKRN